MKKFIWITLVFSVPAFFLGRVIWPDPAMGAMMPTSGQLPYLMFISALEALLFGFGVAFLFYGWPLVKRHAVENKKRALPAFISICWLLVSWWPHDNMHRANGENVAGLIRIEYMFHFTLIIASFIVARYFWSEIEHQAEIKR